MNTIIGDGTMLIGGAQRPYYIGTRQTAVFCELQGGDYDLQDYNKLFGEVFSNSFQAQQAKDAGEKFTPTGRKELKPGEVRDFVYSALQAGAKREGYAVDFDADTVADWIDQAEADEVMKPVMTHLALLGQRIQRQQTRPGNVPALKVSQGAKKSAKKPAAKRMA
jgi:hypothetical protein